MAKFTTIFVFLALAVIANCHPARADVNDSADTIVDIRHNVPVVNNYPLPPIVVPVTPPMERSQRHCGPLNGNKLCEDGLCCSIYGKCGSTRAHCVTKCDYRFGVCRDGPNARIASDSTASEDSSDSNDSIASKDSSDSNDSIASKDSSESNGSTDPTDSTDTSDSNDSSEEIEKAESGSTTPKVVFPDLPIEDIPGDGPAPRENTTPIKKEKVSAVEKKSKLPVLAKFTESEVKPTTTVPCSAKFSSFCTAFLPSTHIITGTLTSDGDKTTLSDVAMAPIST